MGAVAGDLTIHCSVSKGQLGQPFLGLKLMPHLWRQLYSGRERSRLEGGAAPYVPVQIISPPSAPWSPSVAEILLCRKRSQSPQLGDKPDLPNQAATHHIRWVIRTAGDSTEVIAMLRRVALSTHVPSATLLLTQW